MRLIVHRLGHVCNGDAYDTAAIARKAYRLASGPLVRDAETVSEHDFRHGAVILRDNPDHGYLPSICDARIDADELWGSWDLDEMIERYTGWVRTLG